ncbi:DNA/RNA non-specific endonuclease [Nocardiopsis tropica]|uniref:DNA/RNA non-specific endonuclease n=1 Tax=Nocardiopsis tropica TaxID=109330 RepID=A0ABV1ZU64_9ACTN
MCTPTGGLINPSMFPVPTADPAELETLAGQLRTAGTTVSGIGADIKSAWSGLSGCYTAPESGTLLAAVDSVATDGDSVETSTGKAATALETFAEAVRDIKGRWATLTTDSNAFLNSIDTSNDDWKQADGFWNRLVGNESDKVGEHQALLDRADALRQEYEQAERDCANAINADIPGRTSFVSANADGSPPGANEYQHGFDGYLGDVDMAWGGSQETDHGWWVDAGSAVKDFGVGIAEDVGGFVGIHNSDGWFQGSWGDNLWEYHEGNLQSAASLVGMYDAENDSWGFQGWERTGEIAGGAWKDAAHAVVPWEEWGERPGYVIGTALLNIGATVAGVALSATGVGAVVGAPLLAWRGSAMLNRMGGDGPSVNTPDIPEFDVNNLNLGIPGRFGGSGSPTFDFDMSDLDTGSFSPSQLGEMRAALDRINGGSTGGTDPVPDGTPDNRRVTPVNNNGDDGADNPSRNRDATADQLQATDDFLDIVNNPENADFGREVTQRNQAEIDEVDRNAKTGPNREGSWEGNDIEPDRPDLENDPARVPVTPRGDTMEADRPRDTSAEDVYRLTGTGPQDFDTRADTGDTGNGPEMRDRTPTVTNSVDNGVGARTGDAGHADSGNGSSDSGTLDQGRSGSGTTASGDLTGHGPGTPTHVGSGTDGGSGQGPDGGSGPRIPNGDTPQKVDADNNPELRPRANKVFGEGVDLPPNSKFDVAGRGVFYTDADGRVVHAEVKSGEKYKGWSVELRHPRPDATYVVDGRYTYQTDSLARTVSVEGDLENTGSNNNRRHPDQGRIGNEGAEEYRDLNDDNDASPNDPQNPEFRAENADWNGGHLIGTQFFGAGERLNLVPMLENLNQSKSATDTHRDNYYKLEEEWARLTQKDPATGLPKAQVSVKIRVEYAADMTTPNRIRVDYSIDGVPQKPVRLSNIPEMN